MNRRKFLKDASALSAGLALAAMPTVASASPQWVTENHWRTLTPAYCVKGDVPGVGAPYVETTIDVTMPFMPGIETFRGHLYGINSKPFLGHAKGTVLFLGVATRTETGPTHVNVTYTFGIAPKDWNAFMGDIKSNGKPLYSYADFFRLPWGPTPAENGRLLGGKPVSYKVSPC